MATKTNKREYLARVLQLNPVTQADVIVLERERFLGKTPGATNALVDREELANKRDNIQRALAELRREFWTQSPKRLNARLDALPVAKFPDLKSAINRMKLLLVFRDQINKLSKEPSCNVNLLNTFKRIVMSTPREAGRIKERYLRGMSNYTGEHEKEGKKTSRKSMVKMLKKKYREIYDLESSFFNEILRAKTAKPAAEFHGGGGGGGFEIPGWVIVIGGMIFYRVVITILRLSGAFQ